ncbi:MAG: thioredoxin [Candidatus Bathyarchaeia archaeon]|nr:thioredoxin [Candidatus Bathyarchaeota archaeon]
MKDLNEEIERIKIKKMKELMRRMSKNEESFPAEPIKVVDETIDDFIHKYSIAVLDCWAEWCGPCRMIAPIIDQLAREYSGKIVFGKLNVDENPEGARRFGIMSIPTLLIFKDGKLIDRIIGALPKNVLEAKLNKLLKG